MHPDWLIDMAYYYLFHSDAKLVNYTMDKAPLLPHYIASLYPCEPIDTTNSDSEGYQLVYEYRRRYALCGC